MSINKAILVGFLGGDPETRQTQSGQSVCSFSIATNEAWTDKQGQKQQRAEWHKIVVWGVLAENCAKYLSKGRQVYLEGKIATRKWTDKEGIDRYTTEIVAHEVQFLGGGDSAGHSQSSGGQQRSAAGSSQPSGAAVQQGGFDDDIPF